MKLTTKRLKQLIREELGRLKEEEQLNEFFGPKGNISLSKIKQMLLDKDPNLQNNKWYQKLLQVKYVSGGNYNYYDWEEELKAAGNKQDGQEARAMFSVLSNLMKQIEQA